MHKARRRILEKENETLNTMAINEKRLYIRIAGLALQGLIAQGVNNYQCVAQKAFNFADAFMKEYQRRHGNGDTDFFK